MESYKCCFAGIVLYQNRINITACVLRLGFWSQFEFATLKSFLWSQTKCQQRKLLDSFSYSLSIKVIGSNNFTTTVLFYHYHLAISPPLTAPSYLAYPTEEDGYDASEVGSLCRQKGGVTEDEEQGGFQQRVVSNRGEFGAKGAGEAKEHADEKRTREHPWKQDK